MARGRKHISRRNMLKKELEKYFKSYGVGLLIGGQVDTWDEFKKLRDQYLLPGNKSDLEARLEYCIKELGPDINKFCQATFEEMPLDKLAQLCDQIILRDGFDCLLKEFEDNYCKFLPKRLKEVPQHATVIISLSGLNFFFPERFLSYDIIEGIKILKENSDFKEERDLKKLQFGCRSIIINCINLLEAYLNGLAWNFLQDKDKVASLSKAQRKILIDEPGNYTKLKDKLRKWPNIISDRILWYGHEEFVNTFIEKIIPYRDALVHPAPPRLSPEFDEESKLVKLYTTTQNDAALVANYTCKIITTIYTHIHGETSELPVWLNSLNENLPDYEE